MFAAVFAAFALWLFAIWQSPWLTIQNNGGPRPAQDLTFAHPEPRSGGVMGDAVMLRPPRGEDFSRTCSAVNSYPKVLGSYLFLYRG